MATERERMSDAELLTLARNGDKAAVASLLERHQAQVYRFGMRMCRDPEDAQDVLQDTLLAMARGVHDFRGASSISTWLYTVARSFCIKKRRRSKFAPVEASLETTSASAGNVADPAQHPDEALASKQVELALEQAIHALDPAQREVLSSAMSRVLARPKSPRCSGSRFKRSRAGYIAHA